MDPQADAVLKYIDKLVQAHDDRLLRGASGGGDPMQNQWINYRVDVVTRRNLLKIKDGVNEIFKGEEPKDTLEPHDETMERQA
jgi:hypothetical protein